MAIFSKFNLATLTGVSISLHTSTVTKTPARAPPPPLLLAYNFYLYNLMSEVSVSVKLRRLLKKIVQLRNKTKNVEFAMKIKFIHKIQICCSNSNLKALCQQS
jgi:hypothetical protein